MEHTYICVRCGTEFQSRRADKKYCTRACYFASRNKAVTRLCEICGVEFTTPYRFRTVRTCSSKCNGTRISQTSRKREVKQCLACGCDFEVTQSHKNERKYCSYECFLHTRKSHQSDVILTCEGCKHQFSVSFTKSHQRFCSHSCAGMGENNSMFGKPGSMTGKPAWNRGLTTKTDDRVCALGRKISVLTKKQFQSGRRSHVGSKNPNHGHTADTLTPEKRRHFSEAAIRRVLAGQSGYKTGHVTGTYDAAKSMPVRFKSSWELAAMMWWDLQSFIDTYEYEPEIIILSDGRRAIPDFLLHHHDGSNEFVEIKPTQIQQLPSVHEKLCLVREALKSKGYTYRLMGDDVIKPMIAILGEAYVNAINGYKSGE